MTKALIVTDVTTNIQNQHYQQENLIQVCITIVCFLICFHKQTSTVTDAGLAEWSVN